MKIVKEGKMSKCDINFMKSQYIIFYFHRLDTWPTLLLLSPVLFAVLEVLHEQQLNLLLILLEDTSLTVTYDSLKSLTGSHFLPSSLLWMLEREREKV